MNAGLVVAIAVLCLIVALGIAWTWRRAARQSRIFRDVSSGARKELEAKGMLINDVPVATLAKMRELTNPVAEKFASSYDPAIVKIYRAEMDKVHATIR